MNPLASTSEAARPRIPAIHPAETAIPASCHSSSVDRWTGIWWPVVRFAACAQVSDAKLARARTCAATHPR